MMKIKQTEHGWWVLDGDTHVSRWVEGTGDIEHNCKYEDRYREFVKPGDVVLDIGANLGDTTVPLARLVGPQGRVYAVEPHPVVFECMMKNCQKAGVGGQVIGLNIGAGSSQQDNVPFLENPNVGASCIAPGNEDNKGFYIQIRKLDYLELTSCSFIKMDIEGFEMFAVRGLEQTIARCRPVISMELSAHGERYGFDKIGIVAGMIVRGYIPDLSLTEIMNDRQPDVIFRPAGPQEFCI